MCQPAWYCTQTPFNHFGLGYAGGQAVLSSKEALHWQIQTLRAITLHALVEIEVEAPEVQQFLRLHKSLCSRSRACMVRTGLLSIGSA